MCSALFEYIYFQRNMIILFQTCCMSFLVFVTIFSGNFNHIFFNVMFLKDIYIYTSVSTLRSSTQLLFIFYSPCVSSILQLEIVAGPPCRWPSSSYVRTIHQSFTAALSSEQSSVKCCSFITKGLLLDSASQFPGQRCYRYSGALFYGMTWFLTA